LSNPTKDFAEDLEKFDAVFRSFHSGSKDGLMREPGVIKKLTQKLADTFPDHSEKLLKKFARSRTFFRMRNIQRERQCFTYLSLFFQEVLFFNFTYYSPKHATAVNWY